ncbi:acetolactate synthase large subunit [Peribacillus huizhouensis]|uniref:Acetolactate synthase-1/2/3 large subunit n=1 Tax=Peribacillus huizhouensis TaxID=1501239 RepID=A0ABR6CR77_9BACI|nr:acetolactate synthase large subunit [Peribacillus huizhouensis]MBA9027459.1 acetolactate synthase-1/2/3 large subunit [Peribacillus huizhouensis]
MKVTDVLVQCLENEGVEYVFGIPGKEILDLVDSLSRSHQIQFVNVRHEQGAAFMADVYGRLSNKVGVCLSTLGPGATNLLTGISSAKLDHSPVVVITGQAAFERQHKESHQYLDMAKVFEPATKWSIQIKDSQRIPEIIRKAFRVARMEKPGPVAIELPENLASQMISSNPLPITPVPESIPVMESINDALTLMQQYKKPLVIIGNGVVRQEAVAELHPFIEALQAPVIHSFMAKGVLPQHHPLNFFTFGFNEKDEVSAVIKEADLLIVIGFDFVEKLPKEWNKKKLPIIHLDAIPAEMDEYYPVQVELVGNIKQTLRIINQLDIPTKSWVPFGNLQEKIKQSYQIEEIQKDLNSLPLTIENILHIIEKLSSMNTIVISDVGAHKVSIARTYQPRQPKRLIISNGLASMGIAIPGSIGAKLACPGATVICITGDGGALMNFSEIETAKRLGLSFIIIVINDSILKLEQETMNKMFGKSYGIMFQNPDFVQLATSFGVIGRRVNHVAEFENTLKEALCRSNELVIIDVTL